MKKCKGTGKAKGFGCNKELDFVIGQNGIKSYKAKYGLGYACGCFAKWLYTSEKGEEILHKSMTVAKRKVEKEKKAETRRKKDELNSSRAMKLADMYFSQYIRLKHSENGFCTCYTCGDINPIKGTDNGHWQKRKEKSTRYHENNCRPQCRTCNGNTAKNGMQLEFRENLVRELGEDEVQELERLAKTTIDANSYFYRAIATKYRKLVNDLQKELGVKYW
jgi:hypothetical protein